MHDLARMFNGRAALVAGLVTFIIVFLPFALITISMYNDYRRLRPDLPDISIRSFSFPFWNSAIIASAIGVFVGLMSSPEMKETNLRKNREDAGICG